MVIIYFHTHYRMVVVYLSLWDDAASICLGVSLAQVIGHSQSWWSQP